MKLHHAISVIGALLCAVLHSRAGEKVTLVAESPPSQIGYSEPLTLDQGESAELSFNSASPFLAFSVTIGGREFVVTQSSAAVRPITVAGPAVIKLRVGNSTNSNAENAFAVFDVTRTGIASNPTPIPQEAGTVWQVILEASADLVNWSAVAPGDYPSSTPQRYFRTRLVKRP